MKAFASDTFVLPLPDGHRFPMEKYARLRARVESELRDRVHVGVPEAVTDDELRAAHDPGYVERVRTGALDAGEIRRIGFPWSPGLVERSRRSCGATLAAARTALREGAAVNLAGGTHHAHRDSGAGFCVFNDSLVTARVLQRESRVERVLVIDCDVHQGDGTASMAGGDPTVFTVSLHGEHNFPFRKAAGDVDVPLPDGCGDREYLAALDEALGAARSAFAPDLVLYLAGADPFEGDRLGRLALTKAGLAARDRQVLESFAGSGGVRAPVAVSMAGGYAENIEDTVDIHFETVRLAAEHAACARAAS